jgi:hypothetical protein
VEGFCVVADCTKRSYTRGHCQYHYDYLRRRGRLPPLQTRQETDGPCKFDGCPTKVYAKGMCNAHYQQARRGSVLVVVDSWKIPAGAVCTAPGCDRPQYSLTLCRTHYQQQSEGRPLTSLPPPRPAPDGSCQVADCTKTAENAARGDVLCLSHGVMQRRGSALVPLITRTPTDRLPELLARGVYWCTVCQQELPVDRFIRDHQRDGIPRSRCRSCSGILARANKFNISFADVDRLFAFQDRRCALCPAEPPHIDGLNLDHDHNCCPDKGRSCGKCVRGLLCWNCNAGVVTWYERLRGTVPLYPLFDKYLDEPPAARLWLTEGGTRP